MRLRETALETFGAGAGYRNTRLADLCRTAGLSTRQFYQEYDTLEDLLSELYLHINELVEQQVRDEVGRMADQPLPDQAAALVHAYLLPLVSDRRRARIAFVVVGGGGERRATRRGPCRSRWVDLLCEGCDHLAARGEIAARDFRLIASAFIGSISGQMHDWSVGWVDATTPEFAESLLRMLLGVLDAADKAPAPPGPGSGSTRPPVRRRPRDRRATILQAATGAFAERGYHRTSMADIAAAVGITQAALYRHFRTKQDLLGSCLREGLDLIVTRVAAARERPGADDAALAELVRVALEIRGLSRLWQLEFRSLTPADRVAGLSRAVRLTVLIRRSIRARRPDLTASDHEALSWVVLSVVTSPSNHRTQLPADHFARVLDAVVDAVIGVTLGGEALPSLDRAGADDASIQPAHELRGEQMIVAAARLFSDRGFGAVSIEDIGASVGVSGPALYHHFAGKTQLLNEIIDRNSQWVEIYARRALTEGQDPYESLRLVLRYYIRFAIEHTDLVGTAVSEVGHLPDEAVAHYRRIHREGNIGWARLLQTVRPELSISTARVLIHTITTLLTDVVRNPRLAHRADLPEFLRALGEQIALAEVPTLRSPELCDE
ncbi:TetR/AcrR family transcriptional regulator [Nocardia sp. NPDC058497]|uniref:TetR/AcrR family transcriptional regulator n=1 Tax=Nocardia sp. NPDC058497 TaxID=3346529 RepID=UPI003650EFE1